MQIIGISHELIHKPGNKKIKEFCSFLTILSHFDFRSKMHWLKIDEIIRLSGLSNAIHCETLRVEKKESMPKWW